MNEVLAEPYYEVFVMDDEYPAGKCGFLCSTCRRPVDDAPCPDHAPHEVPGLALVECEATPRHWAWVLAGDGNGYGIPCYRCILDEQAAERRATEDRRNGHWVNRWRYWKLTGWAASWAYRLGVISGYGAEMGAHEGWRVHAIGWRWRSRPYVLGVKREVWRCWLRGHRRGEEVGFGFCGKCVPWPCCGSIRQAHKPGCGEDAS